MCYLRPRLAAEGRCRFSYPIRTVSDTNGSDRILPFDDLLGADDTTSKAVLNRVGREALGCMLGVKNMPTMCASYPLTTELQHVDFWHVRTMFWKGGESSKKLAAAWQAEEKYVIVESPSCEGFHVEDTSLQEALTPIRSGAIININVENSRDYEVSIDQFIQGAGDVSSKWEEMQWFMQLIESVALTLPIENICDKSVEQIYLNTLALVWYNFDKLACAKSRPFKSYKRLKADITQMTWLLVNQTVAFLATTDVTGDKYISLIDRLNISVK